MQNLTPEIISFLEAQHIAAFTTIIADDSLHSAALHFSQSTEPFEIYFSTDRASRKCQALSEAPTQASIVIGLSSSEWITMQLSGEVVIVEDAAEIERIQEIHYEKNPGSRKFKDDPGTVMLKFTPTWWRFTNFNTSPVTLVTNE